MNSPDAIATHPSGEIISFYDEEHKYIDSKDRTYNSVTRLIHDGFPPFDTDKIAGNYAKKNGLIKNDVIKMWEDNCNIACDFGTRVHLYCENYLLNKLSELPEATNEKDESYFKSAKSFIDKELRKYTLIDPEKIIFSPERLLAGMVDIIMKDKDGNILILDWKTNKQIKYKNPYQNGLDELSHMQDCNYNHYLLQLNIYRKMLDTEGYFRFMNRAKMNILYVTANGVQVIPVKVIDKEVDYLLGIAKSKV